MSVILVYSTFPQKEDAHAVSKTLVEQRLVACANILAPHSSLYWWEGEVQASDEVAVIYKTRADLYEKVESKIKRLHSYDSPCVISWEISKGAPEFLQWIEETAQKHKFDIS